MKPLQKRRSLLLAAAIWGWPSGASAEPGDFSFGIPERQTLFGELGYSGLPRVGYLAPLGDNFALGGEFIVDVGLFNSLGQNVAGTVTIAGAAPIKVLLAQSENLSIRLGFTPGLGVNIRNVSIFSETLFTILLHQELNVSFLKIGKAVTLGATADIPLTIFTGDFTNVIVPILTGPTVEYQIIQDLVLTGDLGLGPHIIAGDASRVDFGLKIQAGVAWSF